MLVDLQTIQQVRNEADCLYTEPDIEAAIGTMAQAITARLADSNPLLYCVMNGGLVITGKLLTQLPFPLQVSYVHATRYRQQLTGGQLAWKVRPDQPLTDRTVLIIDDILDEGHTLDAIVHYCNAQGAKQVLTAVLVEKQHERKVRPGLTADFVALSVEDRYVFGYGLDYQGYWRNASSIYGVKER